MDLAQTYGPVPRMGVLPNAVEQRRGALEPYSGGEKIILFAARMEAVKGPLLLLKAVAILKKRNHLNGMRFLMVGGGSLHKKVKMAIDRNGLGSIVTLENAAPFERMADLYKSSYALVLPSVVEGYPTTILEAGTYGIPAIATRTIGNSDAIEDGETGLLFPLHDAEGLAETMLRLAGDAAWRNRLGENAFERSKKFTIKNTANAFVEAIGQQLY
jgi:glycosyltransferase involved in cell wall biosynthesis